MRNRIYVSLIIVMLLTSCAGKPSVVLDDKTCNAPCWRSIEIGKTTQEEAKSEVLKMPDVQVSSIKMGFPSLPMMEESIYWNFGDVRELNGSITFHDQKVTSLSFNYTQKDDLKYFIEKFGEPSEIIVRSLKGEMDISLTAYLIYPEKGICLLHDASLFPLQDPKTYSINESTAISFVDYIDPSLTNGQLITGCLRGASEENYKEFAQKWNGYNEYTVNK